MQQQWYLNLNSDPLMRRMSSWQGLVQLRMSSKIDRWQQGLQHPMSMSL